MLRLVLLLTTVWTDITDLCTFVPFAPCTLHFAVNWFCVIVFFVTIGGQLTWALCLSGNPPLCVLLLSVFTALLFYRGEWTFSLSLSLSLSSNVRLCSSIRRRLTCCIVTTVDSITKLLLLLLYYYYYCLISRACWSALVYCCRVKTRATTHSLGTLTFCEYPSLYHVYCLYFTPHN